MTMQVIVSLLLLLSLSEDISVEGTECLSNLTNFAVYEGDNNVVMNLIADPNNVQWSLIPTSDEFDSYQITDYGGTRNDSLSGLFYPNASGLVILNATMNAYGGPCSTAGLYIAQCANSDNRTAAKLVVVRKPLKCSCNSTSSNSVQLSCSIIYADFTLNPIYANMTWTLDGVFYTTDTPLRTRNDTVFVSTSTITVDNSVPDTFTCTVTFNPPTDIQYDFIATNAPEFSASCSVEACLITTTSQPTTQITTTTSVTTMTSQPPDTECLPNLKNIAVYEGDKNILMNVTAAPHNVKWMSISTSNEFDSNDISDYSDQVNPSYDGVFYLNRSGLVILDATTNPVSTSGLFIAQCLDNENRTAAKFIVVRKAPYCSCNASVPNDVQLTCTLEYADFTLNPINANMTWTTDGVFYTTDTPPRTMDDNVFVSTSTITVDNSVPVNFTCTVAFNAPTDIQYDFIATNAPEFSASCLVDVCGVTTLSTPTTDTPSSYCYPNMKNIAVREGTLNVLMNVTASPCAVTLMVLPTSDEFGGREIKKADCTLDPELETLYYVNGTGLIIRNSTTTVTQDDNSMSTSGLYIADCNDNGNRTGAKFLVVRSGPTCSCINDTSSSNVQLTCSVEYADGSINPIPAIMTWFVNEENITTDQPSKNKTDSYVFTATSTITVDYVYVNSYQCLLTFGEPTDRMYDWIATNAPEFSESCSTPCEYEVE